MFFFWWWFYGIYAFFTMVVGKVSLGQALLVSHQLTSRSNHSLSVGTAALWSPLVWPHRLHFAITWNKKHFINVCALLDLFFFFWATVPSQNFSNELIGSWTEMDLRHLKASWFRCSVVSFFFKAAKLFIPNDKK